MSIAAQPRYVSSVIFVQNVETSKRFYHDILNQEIEMDSGAYVGFKGGFCIWEGNYALETIFEHKRAMTPYGLQNCEVYFELDELDAFIASLQNKDIEFIHDIREHPWGQRSCRIFDPDGHIVEFAGPMDAVVRRYRQNGLSNEKIQQKTTLPMEMIKGIN